MQGEPITSITIEITVNSDGSFDYTDSSGVDRYSQVVSRGQEIIWTCMKDGNPLNFTINFGSNSPLPCQRSKNGVTSVIHAINSMGKERIQTRIRGNAPGNIYKYSIVCLADNNQLIDDPEVIIDPPRRRG